MSPDRPDAEPGAPGDPDDATAAEAEADMGARVAALEAEAADCKDRLLRALAEQENSRRRSQREREEAIRFAAAGLGRDLLATADNLRRAIESVPDQTRADETTDRLLAGVVATERALLDALEKHGIRRVDALGQPFDPARHEAVFRGDRRRESPGHSGGGAAAGLSPSRPAAAAGHGRRRERRRSSALGDLRRTSRTIATTRPAGLKPLSFRHCGLRARSGSVG